MITVPADRPQSGIGAAWITAYTLGALFTAAAGIAAFGLGRLMAVSGTAGVTAKLIVYYAIATTLVVLAFALFASLTGNVLRRKLPAFKVSRWIALYLAFGLVAGFAVAFAGTLPDEQPESYTWEFFKTALVGATILMMVAGAILGAIQALVLRHAARGLMAWVGYSALAGAPWMAISLATLYGPKTGFARELAFEAAVLAATIVTSIIKLPAVWRLTPRLA